MRIQQCHISKSVHDFPFKRLYNLHDINDRFSPCIFFGCYGPADKVAILSHKSLAVIWWCGQDALDFKEWSVFGDNVVHITERVKVFERLKAVGVNCRLYKSSNLAEKAEPSILGNKVFAYCPASYPKYHGVDIINSIRSKIPYEIIIGDGSINQNDWRAGACEEIYKECFIGLVLSHFAGGGASVIELGVRGRKCVTNVIRLGNVINWDSEIDVLHAIETEAKRIGELRLDIVNDTINSIDHNNTFLMLSEYEYK